MSDCYADGYLRWSDSEADTFSTREEANRSARELNGIYNGCTEVVIREWEECVLRWVVKGR